MIALSVGRAENNERAGRVNAGMCLCVCVAYTQTHTLSLKQVKVGEGKR